MRRSMLAPKLALVALLVLAVAVGSLAVAGKPPGTGKCRHALIACLDVWDPVICDDGVVYSNACYAKRACATGCVPTGGGPVPF